MGRESERATFVGGCEAAEVASTRLASETGGAPCVGGNAPARASASWFVCCARVRPRACHLRACEQQSLTTRVPARRRQRSGLAPRCSLPLSASHFCFPRLLLLLQLASPRSPSPPLSSKEL
eukprot:1676864-Pleurochrysis_carterae.AAC.1